MSRHASAAEFAKLADDAHRSLDKIGRLWEHVAWQRLAGQKAAPSARPLPTSEVGYDGSQDGWTNGHADPTIGAVLYGYGQPETDDKRAMLEVLAALDVLHKGRQMMDQAVHDVRIAARKVGWDPGL